MKIKLLALIAVAGIASSASADILMGDYSCGGYNLDAAKISLSKGRAAITFPGRKRVDLKCNSVREEKTNSYNRLFKMECNLPNSSMPAIWFQNWTASMGNDNFAIILGAELKNMLRKSGEVEGHCGAVRVRGSVEENSAVR